LAVIMVIGILVGVFLAATQINEPTISFVPKFLGTGLALVVLGPWLLRQLEAFTIAVLTGLPQMLQ
jgi:flagellar biosynthetic protein FliQ